MTEPKFIEFYTTNCCRALCVGKIAQLNLKNLYRTEKTLSGARFCELLSDWSKTLLGSQDLVSGHKGKKSVLTLTPTLGVLLEIVLLNFTKIKRRVSAEM